jgi:hypothetical protein
VDSKRHCVLVGKVAWAAGGVSHVQTEKWGGEEGARDGLIENCRFSHPTAIAFARCSRTGFVVSPQRLCRVSTFGLWRQLISAGSQLYLAAAYVRPGTNQETADRIRDTTIKSAIPPYIKSAKFFFDWTANRSKQLGRRVRGVHGCMYQLTAERIHSCSAQLLSLFEYWSIALPDSAPKWQVRPVLNESRTERLQGGPARGSQYRALTKLGAVYQFGWAVVF